MQPNEPQRGDAASFGAHLLDIDPQRELDRISALLSDYLARTHRKGVVVALSGGIDSSVVAAAAVLALGKERVFGLHLPERESSPESLRLSSELAQGLGIDSEIVDITGALEAVGCYRIRDEAIRQAFPEYREGYRSKIVLPDLVSTDALRLFSLVIQAPDGSQQRRRLSTSTYLQIVAATNFKQRMRTMLSYHHADRLNFLVAGTPNRLEFDQGFFVKLGDGAADVKPIAHLYKGQVHALAEFLKVPAEIRSRPSTTDTYTLEQSQEEFYFCVPSELMDLCLYAHDAGVQVAEVAAATGLDEPAVNRVFADIEAKRRTTRYLHLQAGLVEPVLGPAL